MPDYELDALARAAQRKHRLPPRAVCEACATTEHLSRRPDGRVLCYAHAREAAGARSFEMDHPAGVANLRGFKVPLEPNAHRTVTEWRTSLGIDDWPLAAGDPLLLAAHILAGLASLLLLLAAWLVELAAHAAQRLGPSGWKGAPSAPVIP